MHYEAEVRRAFLLEFCERGDHRHDFFPSRRGVGPIGKKTIAQIFVNNAVVVLDDFLASKNPRSEKNVQVLALHPAAKRRETANVRDDPVGGGSSERTTAMDRMAFAIGSFQPGTFLLGRVHTKTFYQKIVMDAKYLIGANSCESGRIRGGVAGASPPALGFLPILMM